MKKILLFAFMACSVLAFAQNAYEYYGDKVQLEAHYFQSRSMGKLQGDKKQAYQGMDIAEGYLASAQATGIVTIYKLDSDISKEKQLKLPNFSKTTNAYNLSFGTQKFNPEDALPLLYVSGNDGELNVVRFDKKLKMPNLFKPSSSPMLKQVILHGSLIKIINIYMLWSPTKAVCTK